MNKPTQRILILDFGSQYTQLIARRVRDIGVYCEIFPFNITEQALRKFAPQGIILSGGPESVVDSLHVRAPDSVFQLGCPVLGICYGMQTMAVQLGGKVVAGTTREFGYAQVQVNPESKLLGQLHDQLLLDVWMSHGDHVIALPPNFVCSGNTMDCAIVAMADEQRHFYGVQFHPEVSHTPQGQELLRRFVLDICECQPSWTSQQVIHDLIESIRAQVGDEHVVLGLSGGVDSSVAALLIHEAVGKQLTCVFVDTGLLRLHEADEIKKTFAENLNLQLITVNAEAQFLAALAGVSDPEQKRKICGQLFVELFDQEAKKIPQAKWLAQGTIYSDVIESAATHTGKAHVIKSHHNVGGLPEKMHLKLLEPLRGLFKDEVRKIGVQLGLPVELLHRHPFPGPGLAVRIVGEIKKEYVDKLRLADAVLIDELCKSGWYDQTSQAFVVFLPIKSVGVLGDARHYDHVVAVRVVQSIDFMTAHVAPLPHELLERISNRIINEVRGISRVIYDISSKPPATIEWE